MPRWGRNSLGITAKRQALLDVLAQDGGEPKSAREVAAVLGWKESSAASQLWYLQQRGYVQNTWKHKFAPGPRWLLTDTGRHAVDFNAVLDAEYGPLSN